MNVGLWGRTANITQTGFHGNWGQVFKEAEPGESGMPAFSVQVWLGVQRVLRAICVSAVHALARR